jgi:hypothetical protein
MASGGGSGDTGGGLADGVTSALALAAGADAEGDAPGESEGRRPSVAAGDDEVGPLQAARRRAPATAEATGRRGLGMVGAILGRSGRVAPQP